MSAIDGRPGTETGPVVLSRTTPAVTGTRDLDAEDRVLLIPDLLVPTHIPWTLCTRKNFKFNVFKFMLSYLM